MTVSSISQSRWFPFSVGIGVVLAALVVGFRPTAGGAIGDARAATATVPPKPAAEPRTVVSLAPATPGPVDRPIHGTGIVRLKSEADLSFKVGGVVASVLVDEGAQVKKGQILARLDPTEVDAALRQAREGRAKAERDFDRVSRLHSVGAIAVADRDNAATGLELARAAVSAAEFNAQRSAIVAPDDGRVDRRMIEPGEVVAPGRPVLHLSGRSKGAIVRVGLTDRDVLRVKEGDAATVTLDAKSDEAPIAGHVAQIATVATPGAGTFDVEVKLDVGAESLLSGLTAKVEIPHQETVAAVVPIGAIVDGRGRDASVFVVSGDRAKKVAVKVAFILDERVALTQGPPEGAQVIVAGSSELEDGSLVRVVP